MKYAFLLTTVATFALTGVAHSADMAFKAGGPPPSWSWSGFYFGGSLGAGFLNTTADYSDPQNWDTDYPSNPVKQSKLGFAGGGQVGFNYQIRSAVIGIEGDYTALAGFGTTSTGAWPDCSSCGTLVNSKATDLATIRARFGIDVLGGTLIYGTAGVGWLKMHNNMNVTTITPGGTPKGGNFVANSWAPAFVVGAGIEQMIDHHWSVRGEVLWVQAQQKDARPTDLSYFDTTTPPMNWKQDMTLTKIGINYRW